MSEEIKIQLLKPLMIGGMPFEAGEKVTVHRKLARELVGKERAIPVVEKESRKPAVGKGEDKPE